MAAKRKYSDAQRDALLRLHEAGMSSAEIAKAAQEGRTGLAAFTISSRTVRDILAKMTAEANLRLPTTVLELESADAMERAPGRAARIVEAELTRLEEKQRRGKLTDSDIDRLPKLANYGDRIRKLIASRQSTRAPQSRAKQATGPAPAPESFIERLAREEAGGREQPSPAHTHRPGSGSGGKGPPEPGHTPESGGQRVQRNLRPDTAAEKARAALASVQRA